MALFKVSNERAQFDAAGNDARDQYGAGIRFTQGGNARVTTATPTNYNQGIPMSATGQVAIVDATAGLPAGTIFHNGLPISGDKVCVSRNATAVVSNGLPYDAAGAVAGDINLDLNFIGTDTLNSSVTFTRASTGTFFNSAGVLTSAAINAPRFDYDPATLAARGLLIEEQRTNLLTYSEQFDNAASWAATGAGGTVTANQAVAPDGNTTADQLTFTANAVSGVRQNVTLSAVSYTLSCWMRSISGTATARLKYFNGTTDTFSSDFTLTTTWQRFSFTFTGVAVAGNISINNGTAGAIQNIYIWGAQLEAGAFPTSYIPTTTTALTRSADVASVNTLSPWWNSAAGTFYTEFSLPSIGRAARLLATDDGTISNTIVPTINSNNTVGISAINGGVYGGDVNSANSFASANVPYKAAFTFSTSTPETVCLNGGTVATGVVTLPTPSQTRMLLGIQANFAATLNGYLRRVSFYPRQLSNAELQAITA